jgi:hypothetical protein
MLQAIRRLHRILVDDLAASRWLRNRSGRQAHWAHYERHARAYNNARERHAAAQARASSRAAQRHERARERARRLARRHPPRVLPRWQATIGRVRAGRGTADGPGQ